MKNYTRIYCPARFVGESFIIKDNSKNILFTFSDLLIQQSPFVCRIFTKITDVCYLCCRWFIIIIIIIIIIHPGRDAQK